MFKKNLMYLCLFLTISTNYAAAPFHHEYPHVLEVGFQFYNLVHGRVAVPDPMDANGVRYRSFINHVSDQTPSLLALFSLMSNMHRVMVHRFERYFIDCSNFNQEQLDALTAWLQPYNPPNPYINHGNMGFLLYELDQILENELGEEFAVAPPQLINLYQRHYLDTLMTIRARVHQFWNQGVVAAMEE
jgi:hypothetical protein